MVHSFAPQGGFEFGADFVLQKIFQPVAAGGEFGARRRVAVRKFFHQPHGAEREAVGEMFVFAPAKNEFRAAAADIQQQQRRLRQFRVGRHALKHPFGLLPAGDDFNFQSRLRARWRRSNRRDSPRRARRWWR